MIENNGSTAAAFHNHVFLGSGHEKSERKAWAVIWLCGVMMVAEIVGGLMFGSIALVADGMHMSTHAGALLLAALAYSYARKHANDPNFTFGTGKLGDLAGIHKRRHPRNDRAPDRLQDSVSRIFAPVPIHFAEAIPIACLGLAVNIASAWLLSGDGHDHGRSHGHARGGGGGSVAEIPEPHAFAANVRIGQDTYPVVFEEHEHVQGSAARDNNMRAAVIHVIADAAVAVLVIVGLLLARAFGWPWMDPVAGIVGACVIASWSYGLIHDTGAILLDIESQSKHGEQTETSR